MSDDENDYFVPLQDQRVFGAGINRKGIAFVSASSTESFASVHNKPKATNASDRYLSIVLPKRVSQENETSEIEVSNPNFLVEEQNLRCAVCQQPIPFANNSAAVENHEATIAHQVCLEHSHPPSHLDRDHFGFKYLSVHGWDPDSRKGLGARQDGIRIPIKAKEKNDTTGLREQIDEEEVLQKNPIRAKQKAPAKMNAKDARKYDDAARKRAEKLRHLFYDQDLERYLGPAAER